MDPLADADKDIVMLPDIVWLRLEYCDELEDDFCDSLCDCDCVKAPLGVCEALRVTLGDRDWLTLLPWLLLLVAA